MTQGEPEGSQDPRSTGSDPSRQGCIEVVATLSVEDGGCCIRPHDPFEVGRASHVIQLYVRDGSHGLLLEPFGRHCAAVGSLTVIESNDTPPPVGVLGR